jgi:arsenate reductase
VTGTPAEVQVAFDDAYRMLSTRIGVFMSLPIAKLDRAALHRRLREIGKTGRDDDASPAA